MKNPPAGAPLRPAPATNQSTQTQAQTQAPQAAPGARPAQAGAYVARPRRRSRRGPASPIAGWRLLETGMGRLRLWERLHDNYALRAFSVACHRCLPQLEPLARAESVLGDTLFVRVSSSAVASNLKFAEEPLLLAVNEALQQADPSGLWAKRLRPIRRLQFRVATGAHVGTLPDHREWTETRRPAQPSQVLSPRAVDLDVISEAGHLKDTELRDGLLALYKAACRSGRSR